MRPQTEPLRVLVAHADAIVSAGIAALLSRENDMHIDIAGSESRAAADPCPDIIVLDHQSALMHMRRLAGKPAWGGQTRLLIVTQLDREWDVHTALEAGVHGYLLQNSASAELVVAVRAVGRGARYMSTGLKRFGAAGFERISLTSRETDVLQLLAQGQCNKSIASELGIGVGTVKSHVKALLMKLGARARTHAVVLATERGLV